MLRRYNLTGLGDEQNLSARKTLEDAKDAARKTLINKAPDEWKTNEEATEKGIQAILEFREKAGEKITFKNAMQEMWYTRKEAWAIMKAFRRLKKTAPDEWKAYVQAKNELKAADALEAPTEKRAKAMADALIEMEETSWRTWFLAYRLRHRDMGRHLGSNMKAAEKIKAAMKKAAPSAWEAYFPAETS